jgi:serine acetyltransferase
MKIFKELYEEAKNIKEKDPASRNILEVIILYPRFSYINIS